MRSEPGPILRQRFFSYSPFQDRMHLRGGHKRFCWAKLFETTWLAHSAKQLHFYCSSFTSDLTDKKSCSQHGRRVCHWNILVCSNSRKKLSALSNHPLAKAWLPKKRTGVLSLVQQPYMLEEHLIWQYRFPGWQLASLEQAELSIKTAYQHWGWGGFPLQTHRLLWQWFIAIYVSVACYLKAYSCKHS